MELVTKDHIKKLIKFPIPGLPSLLAKLLKIKGINSAFSLHAHKDKYEFIKGILESIGSNIEIEQADLSNIPQSGPFIAVANHPYGGIEGLILLKLFADSHRPDAKIMANFLLKNIPNIADSFIGVNPFENIKGLSNLSGMRLSLEHLKNGNPIAIFPAGEVSTFNLSAKSVIDKKWSNTIAKMIYKAGVPVVPIYFHSSNSLLFHILGMIHPTLRTARLIPEMLNKQGKTIKVRIGKVVLASDLQSFDNHESMMRYVRARTYALDVGKENRVKSFFKTLIKSTGQEAKDIVLETDVSLIEKEIEEIRGSCLWVAQSKYEVFIADAQLIPASLKEICRLREITFRAVGEGTNNALDTDEYDLYYKHMFIWDKEARRIVGSYRLGMGREIFKAYGAKGFYLSTLFSIKRRLHPMLRKSIELGRSFIVRDYQKSYLPIFLLWKTLRAYLLQNSNYKYLIGPVSISGSFSNLSQSLIVKFIKQNYFDDKLSQYVSPKKKFRIKSTTVDVNSLIDGTKSLKSLDNLISGIELSGSKIPVLLRQYIGLNGKIIGFNRDPDFQNCLDGFLVVTINDIPEAKVEQFSS